MAGEKLGEVFVEIKANMESLSEGLGTAAEVADRSGRVIAAKLDLMAARIEIAMANAAKSIREGLSTSGGQAVKTTTKVVEKTHDVTKATKELAPVIHNTYVTGYSRAGAAAAEMLDRINGYISSLKRALAGVFAGVSIGSMVKWADDLQKSYTYAGFVFGQFSGIVIRESSKISKAMGFSRREMVQGTTEIGEALRRANRTPQEAAGIATGLARAAVAAGRPRGVEAAEAMQAVEYALMGSARGMRQLGVHMEDVQVQMEAMRMGLPRLYGEFSESDLVLARASLMFRLLSGSIKAAEETAPPLSTKIAAAWAKLKSAFEDVGTALLPIAHRFADAFNSMAGVVADWVSRHKADMDYFVSVTLWAFDQVRDAVIDLGQKFATFLGKQGIDTSSIRAAFDTLIARVKYFFEDFDVYTRIASLKIQEWAMQVQDVFNWLKTIVKDFTSNFQRYFEESVIGSIYKAIGALREFWKDAVKGAEAVGTIVGTKLAGGELPPDFWHPKAAPAAVPPPMETPLTLSVRNLDKEIAGLNDLLAGRAKARGVAGPGGEFVGPPVPEEVRKKNLEAAERAKRAQEYPPMLRRAGGAEFMGLVEFAKKIQLGAFGGTDYLRQISGNSLRSAIAAEKLVGKMPVHAEAVAAAGP